MDSLFKKFLKMKKSYLTQRIILMKLLNCWLMIL
ncbi:hypothetical protein CBNA_0797 [Coxiella burnetii str. Namibia]|nr:hypothetical protein CBNA_0797 [Coxiella burnetii str. Namibia]